MGDFFVAGGGSPELNPRLVVGLNSPELRILTDDDVMSPAERKHHPFYAELLRPTDTTSICATNLLKDREMMVGLAVLRRPQEGEIEPEQHRLFASLALHARAAFKTQILLENRGAEILAGALESLMLTAFICDSDGYVRAMTPSAASALSMANYLTMRCGHLATTLTGQKPNLGETISWVALGLPGVSKPQSKSLLVRSRRGGHLVLDIVPLPRIGSQLNHGPRVLVLARDRQRKRTDSMALLKAAFDLTEAEGAIALLVSDGYSPERIASERGVSPGTVRIQLKTVFSKLGAHSQVELAAAVRPFL
ncbi:LuxR C-terminal-related transcriptional regulator [Marinobacter sp.]|uniref:helix-turn-helix transcriptional regulator n=1 Tax=Marinobacter sp. TaxID=50741 RepID=UPI00384C5096